MVVGVSVVGGGGRERGVWSGGDRGGREDGQIGGERQRERLRKNRGREEKQNMCVCVCGGGGGGGVLRGQRSRKG